LTLVEKGTVTDPLTPSKPSDDPATPARVEPGSTDEWGIDDRYLDALGKEHRPSAETRAAVVQSMSGGDPRPASAGGAFADVVVLLAGSPWTPRAPGALQLENGETRNLPAGSTAAVPLGYHQYFADGSDRPIRVIGRPAQCHLPDHLLTWGWAAQLYATRSRASWGIGDLADLRRLTAWARDLGAGVVMINPLVAATPVPPVEPSPYFPSSRRFRNPLYLRVEEVPGAMELGDDLARLAHLGRLLNQARRIDRDAVFMLKMDALERCFTRAATTWQSDSDTSSSAPPFATFRRAQGRGLQDFAIYCAAAEVHGKDWRRWPAELRRPGAPGIDRFAEAHARRVTFHAWLQWLIDDQLRRACADLRVIQDLPIGLDAAGADAWCWQDLLAHGVSVGAPPDELNPAGQDWGLVPFIPHRLRSAGYQPFIETIRATARYAGGLRIDHVMGLFRLYWIPRGLGPAGGAYVRTRADELLGIVALESERAQAFVVGEDLGTVEPGVREAMAANRLLSYKLLFFEDHPPAALPELALSTVSTHDLPTVTGLWSGADLTRAQVAGSPQNEEGIRGLRDKLTRFAQVAPEASVPEAIEHVYTALATAPSRVLLATLDDALAVEERPNIPGAAPDWVNWSTALPLPLEELEQQELPRAIARALARNDPPPKSGH
jgi:4-alpha-glucanotransferase